MLGSFSVDLFPEELPHTTITSCLHDGAVFKGTQRSKSKEYDVEVTIQSVDYSRKTLYGYIKMDNLIISYGSLTTYFEGEIISRLYPFVTGKWGATVETDIAHWEKIAGGTPLGSFHSDNFNYSSLENSGTVFMRWKEKFALPRVKEVDGASYAGFYYIGFNKWSGEIFGYYYHLDCEKFQSLQLTYKPEDAPSIFQLR
ncbi:Vacuolar import degradation protein Vid24 [Fasciola gigantica]|uniref:Vacuolar import degradation protein Vid24 n=1 Tax=Fasciola gigantica TaxID=46835 RepID=A0A504YKC7_FASGI|nr:Vacuolar import degradation protein Vid24 [Fasciola gigantica]